MRGRFSWWAALAAAGIPWSVDTARAAGEPHPVLVAPRIAPPDDAQVGVPLQPGVWGTADMRDVGRPVAGGRLPPGKTQCAVVHDGANIFLAVRVTGIDPETIVATSVATDISDPLKLPPQPDLSDEDHVRVVLSPLNSADYAFELRVNPRGAVQTLMRTPEHPLGGRWANLRSGARSTVNKQTQPVVGRITDDGYELVIRLQRAKCFLPDWFRNRIEPGESWAVNVARVSPDAGGPSRVASLTGRLDPLESLATLEGFGTLVMGPTDVAVTRATFGDGFLGRQPVEATITNLTDKAVGLQVKVAPTSPDNFAQVPPVSDGLAGTGKGFTAGLSLGPRESKSVQGSLDVTLHRRQNRIAVSVTGGSQGQPSWEHWFIGRAKVGLHLHDSVLPVGAPWLDIYLSSDLPAAEIGSAAVELSLRDAAGKEIGPSGAVPLAAGRRDIGFALPPLPEGSYTLRGRLVSSSAGESVTAAAPFKIEAAAQQPRPGPVSSGTTGTVPLTLQDLSAAGLAGWPTTFGVPFPDGLVATADELELVDAGGNRMPASIRTAGRWRKSGSLKWAHIDMAATSEPGVTTKLALRHGVPGGGGHSAGPFRLETRDGVVVVTTGPLRFSARQGNGSLIDRVWVDRDGDGSFSKAESITEPGGGLVARLTDEQGRTFLANLTTGSGLTVEELGPASALLRAEGWFELPRENRTSPVSERLCRYVVRVRAVEGSPHLQVSHTFVFTGDSKTTRLADIALETRLAGSPQAVDFGVEGIGSAVMSRQLSLLQHADDGFSVFRTPEGLEKPVASGSRAPGYAALATDRGELLAGVRDFWQLYPKEFEIGGATLTIHLWPAHGKPRRPISALTDETVPLLPWVHEGLVLDFQTPDEYRSYTVKEPSNSIETSVFQTESYDANAVGLAKTHEITLSYAGRPRSPSERAAIGKVIQEPPVCAASPAWMCDSGAFGTVKLHPVDRERFPRIEAAIEGQFDAESRLTERVRAYGMFNYLDTHTWYYFELGRLYWWRVWANLHHGGPRVAWLLYARSADPKYLRAAHRRATHHMEIDVVHHDHPYVRYRTYPHGKTKGALTDYKGLVHWNSGNRLYDYNSMADYLYYDWYFTGNRRGLDVARMFGDAVFATTPAAVGRDGSRGGAGITSAICCLYEETGDERFRPFFEKAGHKMISTQQPDGFHPTFWTSYAPWRGQFVRATDGDPRAVDALRKWCDHLVDWRYCDSDTKVASRLADHDHTNLDAFPIAEDLASGWFLAGGNRDYLRLGLGDLESFSWGMYEGSGHPDDRGFNGSWGKAITLNGYVLQTAPYLLRALVEQDEPVEPLFRRSMITSAEGVTAYLDLPQSGPIDVFTRVHLEAGGAYELRLAGPGGESLPAVPIAVEPRQPQDVRWTSPAALAPGEWKLVLAGKKPTTLVRLDVPRARRITYRLPADENAIFRAPALWFLAPQEPGTISWRMKSMLGDPNGGVLIDPEGRWAGRITWLDLDAAQWHELTAEVTAAQAGKPWLIGSRQQQTLLRPSGNVPRFFAFDREQLFLPERP